MLLKQATDGGVFQAYTYLCSSGPTTEAGFSRNSTGLLNTDVAGGSLSTLDIAGTTEKYIAVVKKGAGNVAPVFQLYTRSTTTWSSPDTGASTLVDQIAATSLEIGTWQGGSDLVDAWIGLVGWWEGAMSQANIEQLDDGWQTSDWWASAHGTPTALIECNVAAASLIDIAGNATSVSVTGSPTLDGAETLDSWNFNGDGSGGGALGAPTTMVDFQRTAFPFMAVSSYKGLYRGGTDFSGISSPTRERGPAAYGGFERYLFRRLHPVFGGGTIFNQALDGTVTSTAAISMSVGKFMTATATSAASIVKQVGKSATANVTSTASIVKSVGKPLTANATVSATMDAIKVILLALTATVTSTATMVRSVGKRVTATVTSTASMARQTVKALTATVTTAATMVRQIGKKVTANATVSATMSAIKVILVALTATVTSTASIVRQVGKNVTATVTSTATIRRSIGKAVAATVTSSASITKQITKTLTATVTSVASMVAQFISGAAQTIYTRFFGGPSPDDDDFGPGSPGSGGFGPPGPGRS